VLFTTSVFSNNERTINELINYGKFYYQLERYKKAIEYFEKILDIDNFNYIAIDYLTKISTLTDYIPKIIEHDIPEISNKNGRAYQWYTNGLFQYERKNYGEATYAFIKAYEIEPSEEAYRIYTFKSKRLYELQLYKEKQERIENKENIDLKNIADKFLKEKTHSEEDSRQWFLKAKFNFNNNKKNQALSELKIALILNSQNLEAKKLLDEIEYEQIQKNKIEEELAKKLEDTTEIVIEPLIEEKVNITEISDKQILTEEIKITLITEDSKEIKKKPSYSLISSKEKITLDDHLSKDKKIIAGLYDLPEDGENTLIYIKEKFDEADRLLKENKFNIATIALEEAYKKALEYNEKDLRALYYLYLISEKKHNINDMKKYFFALIDNLYNKNFKQETYYLKSKELVDSLLFSMIIQGAYNAWFLRTNDANLKMDSLIEQGYLSYVKKINLDIGYKNMGKISWKFSHIHSKLHFKVKNKTVISDIYGVSPLMATEFYIEEE